MSSKIAALSSEIDNYIAENKASVDSKRDDLIGPRFIYLNSCNSRHKGNLSTQSISTDLKNIMMDLFEKDARNISEETIVKTMNDYWILQKNSNLRTFFVLINKYATLLDITGNRFFDDSFLSSKIINFCFSQRRRPKCTTSISRTCSLKSNNIYIYCKIVFNKAISPPLLNWELSFDHVYLFVGEADHVAVLLVYDRDFSASVFMEHICVHAERRQARLANR